MIIQSKLSIYLRLMHDVQKTVHVVQNYRALVKKYSRFFTYRARFICTVIHDVNSIVRTKMNDKKLRMCDEIRGTSVFTIMVRFKFPSELNFIILYFPQLYYSIIKATNNILII